MSVHSMADALLKKAVMAKDDVEAYKLFERVLFLNPQDVEALLGLAAIHIRTADHKGALDMLNTAKRLEPTNELVWFGLGNCYWEMGQPKAAVTSWERCLQLDPDFELARAQIALAQP